MHAHDHVNDVESGARPKSDRVEAGAFEQAPSLAKPDVLGAGGLLGLQRAAGNQAVTGLIEEDRSPVHDVVNSGGGSALDTETRSDMEGRFGTSFSDVRVHTDGQAAASAKAVNAQAYTVGNNIVFQRYEPGTEAGKHMLAHELTHVVQQRSGPVDGTPTGGGISVSNPSDRFEREAVANADRLMSQPAPAAAGAVQRVEEGGSPGATTVQREEEAEEETAQTYVQREEEGEEETAQTFVQREGEEDEGPAEVGDQP
ncbi:hypothetical protein Afil01_13130 [Actinorhabdospora filicis]|uniref:eCIS core domain-containing protein n=1 Tax=Actinorhabdospora filicis TaxID=1785913 RepID=A0A9W6W8I2_9ACTN|nr:DUF4157 domain-containing protein [Actinorhabdospora filicis]GLZ76506.1 hypothetical protein Afil01_13130 [Actinorhabdospora filicis]